MAKEPRITNANVKECLAKGMSIEEIADKYRVEAVTVIRIIKWLKKQEETMNKKPNPKQEIVKRDPARNEFDLKEGDTISAYETEVSKEQRKYKVVCIFDDTFLCRDIKGGWATTFQKSDYKNGQVKLVSRRADYEKSK